MKNLFSVAFHIWIRAIALNALLFGLYSVSEVGIFFILIMVGIFIGGFVCTIPLLTIVVIWLKCFYVLPYENRDKLPWLAFVLMTTAMAFYMLLSLLLQVPLFNSEPFIFWLIVTSLFCVAMAVLLARNTIVNFKKT